MALTPVQKKMWRTALSSALIIFIVLLGYVYIYNNRLNLLAVSQAVAGTAGFLIGTSLALGSLAFFRRSLGPKVANRKYLGLVGFWMALAYSLLLVAVDPQRYGYGILGVLATPDGYLGLSAMALLAYMALISNRWGVRWLGVRRWRASLRLGYIAYALLIVRAVFVEGDLWTDWWSSPLFELPPPRLLLSVFAGLVLLLRLLVEIVKRFKKKSPA